MSPPQARVAGEAPIAGDELASRLDGQRRQEIELGRFVLVLSTLSFLGFGVRPPNPEWGAMLADAQTSFFLAPRLLVYPGVAIALLVLAVNLVGDGLRDALDGRGVTT